MLAGTSTAVPQNTTSSTLLFVPAYIFARRIWKTRAKKVLGIPKPEYKVPQVLVPQVDPVPNMVRPYLGTRTGS